MSDKNVARLVAETLRRAGAEICFGVTGTGNLKMCAELKDLGVRFVPARHECNAAAMAEGYAKATGTLALVSVHCGPGMTNAITAMTEAAKARTPVLLLAGDVPAADRLSNFRIDQDALARSVGLVAERVLSPETAEQDVLRACRIAIAERRAVALNVAMDIQDAPAPQGSGTAELLLPPQSVALPSTGELAELASAIAAAERPIIVGGYGAVLADARDQLVRLADRAGALLATSARAHGLFGSDAFSLGIMGGFGVPAAKALFRKADLVIGFGISFTRWTLQNRNLLGPDCRILQINSEPETLGLHCAPDAAYLGDARATAEALAEALDAQAAVKWRTGETAALIEREAPRNRSYADASTSEVIDPRKLTHRLNEILPRKRVVTTDSGHSQGWPIHYMDIPDSAAWGLSIAFGSTGLGLGTAIGLALGQPDRVAICCAGDGGFMMSIPDLETAARLDLSLCVIVYNDSSYAAEVHYYAGSGYDTTIAEFSDTDFAAMARSVGAAGVTVRTEDDLQEVREWVAGGCRGVLLIDAKVPRHLPADWFMEMLAEMRH